MGMIRVSLRRAYGRRGRRGIRPQTIGILGMVVLALVPVVRPTVAAAPRPTEASAAALPPGFQKITHIVFIIKENRSFDHYFGRFPGADGATVGRTSTGEIVPLRPALDQVLPDIAHSSQAAYLCL